MIFLRVLSGNQKELKQTVKKNFEVEGDDWKSVICFQIVPLSLSRKTISKYVNLHMKNTIQV